MEDPSSLQLSNDYASMKAFRCLFTMISPEFRMNFSFRNIVVKKQEKVVRAMLDEGDVEEEKCSRYDYICWLCSDIFARKLKMM